MVGKWDSRIFDPLLVIHINIIIVHTSYFRYLEIAAWNIAKKQKRNKTPKKKRHDFSNVILYYETTWTYIYIYVYVYTYILYKQPIWTLDMFHIAISNITTRKAMRETSTSSTSSKLRWSKQRPPMPRMPGSVPRGPGYVRGLWQFDTLGWFTWVLLMKPIKTIS